MDVVSPLPAPLAAMTVISASPSTSLRNPRPSSASGSSAQLRGSREGAGGREGARGEGGAGGSGGHQGPAGQGAGSAATPQSRRSSGRSSASAGPAAAAVAEAAATTAAAAALAAETGGDRTRIRTSSATSTPPSSARKGAPAAPGGGGGGTAAAAAASPRSAAQSVRGALFRPVAADGPVAAAAPPPPRPITRTASDEARTEGSLASKPPLPSHGPAAAGRGAADPLAVVSEGLVQRPVKRSSSSSSIQALTTDGRGPGDGDATCGAAARPAAPAVPAGEVQVHERRVSSGQVPASRGGGGGASGASAGVAEKVAFRTPRESSCSGGAGKDSPGTATALLPFSSPSGSHRPPSPGGPTSPPERAPKSQHPSQPGAQQHQQQQLVRQQQQQQQPHSQPAASRAVRFTRGGSASSNTGSPTPTPTPTSLPTPTPTSTSTSTAALIPTLHRRVSDSSSHLSSFSPVSVRDPVPRIVALPPPPLPLGLSTHRRPSEDGLLAAAAAAGGSAAAAGSAAATAAGPANGSQGTRHDRSARSGSNDAGGPPLGANLMWARPMGQTDGSEAGPGSEPSSARGARDASKCTSVHTAVSSPAPPGTGRSSGSGVGQHGKRGGGGGGGRAEAASAVTSGPAGGGGGGIRRAADLGPMSMPGGLDGGLREAFARAAVANVAQLTDGSLLAERDFGYARVVDEHHRKQQLSVQQSQQQQQQAAAQPAEPPSRRPSVQVDPEATAAAAPGTATPPATSPRGTTATARAARPPLGAKSMRSVLKATTPPAGNGTSGGAAAAAALTTTSYRFLSLRRPSSKASAPDSESDNFLSPASTAAGGAASTARSSAWSSVFGGAAGGGSGREAKAAAAAAEADPMGLRTAENVEIRVHCLTFNMGGIVPAAAVLPESLFSGSYLSHDAAADAAHLYVFATQESGPLADWEAAVAAHLGRRYTRVAAESLMSIHILLFSVRSMAPYITDVRTSSVATGVGNVLGNKGGVAVTFSLLGARVLLVGAHFAAHDQNVERRNADFHRICAGLFAPPSTDGTAAAATTTTATMTRSAQATPERTRDGGGGGAAADASGSGKLAADSQSSSGGGGSGGGGCGGGSAAAAASNRQSSTPQRRPPLAPTLSRFSRSGAPSVVGTSVSGESEGGGGGGADAAGGGEAGPARTLTRALSTSSVSSLASNASHAPEGSKSTRMQSFLGGMSFNTAKRHSTALLGHFDVVLWMGDLNYRIAGTPEVVKYAIDENMMEVLRANDQLQKQQKKGKVLQGFQEMPLAFAPTFKFSRGTDNYDLRRAPSWTDRVLYLVNADPMFADLRPLYYMSVPELRTSDHKPVIAGFELSISPQHAADSRHARQRGCVIS